MKPNKTTWLLAVATIFLGVVLGYSAGQQKSLSAIQQPKALLLRHTDCVLTSMPTPEEPL